MLPLWSYSLDSLFTWVRVVGVTAQCGCPSTD